MNYIIRRARSAEDKDEIATLQSDLFRQYAPNPHDGFWWVVLASDDNIVAFGGIKHSPYYQKTGYLCSAAVDWAHRGQGLQKRLIRCRTAFARAQGWSWVVTDTLPNNYASVNSLIGCGFKMFKPWKLWGSLGSLYFGKKL